MGSVLVAIAIFAPLVGAVLTLAIRPAGLGAGRVAAASCGVAFIAAIALVIASGSRSSGDVGDVAGLGLQIDRPASLLLAVVCATGAVVGSFARRNLDLDPRGIRFFVLFGILVTGSALVVVPGNALALVVGWIASSWALVGIVGHRNELRSTGLAQRTVARSLALGDAALLLAIVIAVNAGGFESTRDVGAALDDLQSASLVGVGAADVVAILLVIAGASRSALFPFHRWLVVTLAAPTPVSALVHAGFVSGAGLLLIRFGPVVVASSVAVHLAFVLAVITVAVAIGAGMTRVDVKGKLAWSTVAQMGFMVVQCSVGAFSSAVFHIAGHGMYKASLFLGAGDAVSAGLRSSRRAAPLPLPSSANRRLVAAIVATTAVVIGLLVIPPDVNDAGIVLIALFSWLTVAHGVWGWIERGASTWPRAVAESAIGGLVSVLAYLAGLRAVEYFVKPTFGDVVDDVGVDTATLIATLAVVAAVGAVVQFVASPVFDRLRRASGAWLTRTAHPALAGSVPAVGGRGIGGNTPGHELVAQTAEVDSSTRSQIRADVARASNVIAPTWPITSVVAVNPLGGLEQLGFEQAAQVARQQLGARTHLSLEEFRSDHAKGLTNLDDLRWAIESFFFDECSMPPIVVGDRMVPIASVIEADMLNGPDGDVAFGPRTAVERIEGSEGPVGRSIDASIFHSASQFVSDQSDDDSFLGRSIVDALEVSALRRQLSTAAADWLRALKPDAATTIGVALTVLDVASGDRVDELRGNLARLQGWAGYSKWRTEWAQSDERRPDLAMIELAAARCALEAATVMSGTVMSGTVASGSLAEPTSSTDQARARVEAIAATLDLTGSEATAEIAKVVSLIDSCARNEAWLRAQERNVDRGLLSSLEQLDPGAALRKPEAQLVFCIDVRSEGLRRQIEATGPYDTIGFAGFFGVAMSVQRIEWDHSEARCPVLVAPSVHAAEVPFERQGSLGEIERVLARDRRSAGVATAHARTKSGIGAPFVMAEAAGWVTGPLAAARTLLPRRPASVTHPPTVMRLEQTADDESHFEQRTFTAEAVLSTMGLTRDFAPVVVLSGHTSHNVNNPHATALDCGACAGASGQDNARAVAVLLNDPNVRSGLRARGIEIPDSTSFVAALHDTVADTVEIFDRHLIPASHDERIERLIVDLETAGARQAAARAPHLPGPASTVRQRGTDWAQVRPEWGLARNAAFVIGPRSMTAEQDLEGRAFLHTYDADSDPEGKVLTTIMTAPLVVAHWISSQYYFSTVDPERFGAGDKLIHNVIGSTGVISGEHGDMRVGLPLQSTHVGNSRHHQPVRLLAVIQAPLERIEHIIEQNPILATLTSGSWLRIAGRSHPHERWSLRSANGTWDAEPQTADLTNTLETP